MTQQETRKVAVYVCRTCGTTESSRDDLWGPKNKLEECFLGCGATMELLRYETVKEARERLGLDPISLFEAVKAVDENKYGDTYIRGRVGGVSLPVRITKAEAKYLLQLLDHQDVPLAVKQRGKKLIIGAHSDREVF